ncbi:unnamed protein product, partial [Rotaria sp. Silwood1]
SSSSDNILIELVTELYERTKQSSTLPYEALLLLRPLPLLLAHIGLSDRLMKKMFLEFATSTQHLYPQNRLYSTTTISLEDATYEIDLLFSKLVLTLAGYCSKELQEECKKTLDIKPITASSTILEQIRAVTDVVDNWKTKSHISGDIIPKYDIEKFNNIYNNIQDSLAKITDTNEVNIGELKTKLKTLFENLTDLVFGQSKQIIELESRIAALEETKTINENRMIKLEKKFKMMEKNKVIADLLDPFVKEMYDYINSLPGQPRHYDDSSIFRAFQAIFKNNQTVENEYKEHFDKNINEE